MNQKLKAAFETAKEFIGTKEYLDDGKLNPLIFEFHKTTTLGKVDQNYAWCSSFVNYCVTKAGLIGTNSTSARSWLKWGQPSQVNNEGDIVVLKRGNDQISGHVGFLCGFDGVYVIVLSGNQRDSVCRQKFLIANILDIRTKD